MVENTKSTRKCGFRLEHYKATLAEAKKKYAFQTFSQYKAGNTEKQVILLRHDVDFKLKNALPLARIEGELGIKATYFIRVNARYNLFFHENYNILKEIQELGHEIGLHVTEGLGKLFNEDNSEMIRKQLCILEAVTGVKIKGISAHEPSRMGHAITDDKLKEFGLQYQAYSPIFIKDMKYVSESGGKWYEHCFCEFVSNPEKYPKLCILTHPIWWFKESPVENY